MHNDDLHNPYTSVVVVRVIEGDKKEMVPRMRRKRRRLASGQVDAHWIHVAHDEVQLRALTQISP
jgi:hypothetical protein